MGPPLHPSNPLPMQQPPLPDRRQLLIRSSSRASRSRCGEVAGAKTAECAAICCCLPFAVIDLLVLTAVKLPAGVYRKLTRRRRRRRRVRLRMMKRMGMEREGGGGAREEMEGAVMMMRRSPSEVVKEREEEMWARFHGAGFWRSHSQRDTI